jgi:hypothetical protein
MDKKEVDKQLRRYYNRHNTKRYRQRILADIIESEHNKREKINNQLISENLAHLIKEAPIERR